jgi:predicted CXXCH cytochrome family protein
MARPGAQVCELCHLPTRTPSGIAFAPLWDRGAADVRFAVFGLPSVARISEDGQRRPWPGAATRLCMGCHDGLSASMVIDRGARARPRHHVAARARAVPGRYIEEPVLPPTISRGVIDEHPVFIPYPAQPIAAGFHVPPTPDGWSDVRLVDGQVECVSCHDVHGSTFSLRRSNAGSGLCLTCHRK